MWELTGIDVWLVRLFAGIAFVKGGGVLLDPIGHGIRLCCEWAMRTPDVRDERFRDMLVKLDEVV